MSSEPKIEDALCFNLYTASRLMTQVYRPYLKELDLTYPQFLVMLILWEDKSVNKTVKEIGSRLYLDSGTLSPLLKRLEKFELIQRTRDESDERTVLIKLTKEGVKLQKKTSKIPMEMFCNLKLETNEFIKVRDGVKEVLKNLLKTLEEKKS